ncbi:hypothetical protein ACFL1C_03385 [Pseudomonadota bacterium]
MEKSRTGQKAKKGKKLHYQAPKLSCFGEVRHLTTGGSSQATEGIGAGGQMDKLVMT